MLQLFSSILLLGDDAEYYLVTPVEKVRIRVEDCPFVITGMEVEQVAGEQLLKLTTNTDEVVTVDRDHAIRVDDENETREPHPVVHVRNGLNALINRNVFYRLVDIAEQRQAEAVTITLVRSAGEYFELGRH